MNQTNKKQPRGNIDLTYDRNFKTYFKGSKKILVSLLNQFLPLDEGRKVQKVEILDPILSSEKEKKNPVLDLIVQLDDESSVNIEMQSVSKKNFKERILFYLAKLYTWKLESGEDYKKIPPAYSLVFTNFTVFKELKEHCSVFQLRAGQNPQVVFSKHLSIVLVELNKFNKEGGSKGFDLFDFQELWCYILKNAKRMTEDELSLIAKRGPDMEEATVRIVELSKEKSDQMIDEAIEKNRRDRVAEREYAKEEGIEEGIEQGMKKGLEQGLEKGREQGMEKGMALVASNMLKNKMNMDLITKMTGLSEEEILKLKKKSEVKN